MKTCQATRTDGQPCRANTQAGSDFCFWHDPAQRDRMLAASRKGGRNRRKEVKMPEAEPLTPERVRGILAATAQAAGEGALTPEIARAIGYLLQIESKIFDSHELEKRLEKLEKIQSEV